jgi:hypothetical protein
VKIEYFNEYINYKNAGMKSKSKELDRNKKYSEYMFDCEDKIKEYLENR